MMASAASPTWVVLFIFISLLSSSKGVPHTHVAGHVDELVDLPCVVDSAKCGELHSIKWYRGSSRIFVFSEAANIAKSEGDYSDRALLQYDHNATKSALRINPLKVTDEALYKCEITYIEVREGCSVVQFINLTTEIKPEFLRIIKDDGKEIANSSLIGPINEGQRIVLTCESGVGKPVPVVDWWNGTAKMSGDYSVDVDTNGVGTGRNKIEFRAGRGDLGAKYECRAMNDALNVPIVSTLELDVNVRPLKMELIGVEHHVVQGTNVHLQCIIIGARPAANVTWFNGTEPMREDLISTNSAVKADGTYETQSSLLFTASRYESGGTLTCEAINSVMIDRDESPMKSTLLLEVLYPPIVTVNPRNITINESTDILLFCSYEANPTLLKTAKWLRNDVEVNVSNAHYEGGTIEQPTLLIKNTSRHDQGSYVCILENEVGVSQSPTNIQVNITYKPTVKVVIDPPSPASELDRKNVTLNCQIVYGNPDFLKKVRWYLNGTLLKELPDCSTDSQQLCDIDPSLLLLEDVERGFHGNYSCEGKNDAGWGPLSDPAELVVYYPPGPATLVYEPKKVVKKGTLKLNCRVDDPGRPPTNTFRWVRGLHLVQDVTTSNWTIDPVTLETRANFTCSAYNLGGEGESASVFIEVFAPPSFIERLPPYYGVPMSAEHVSLSCRVECYPSCSVMWLKNERNLDFTTSNLYSVRQSEIPPDPRTNDFESIQSTLIWNMSAWPGGQLNRLHDSANYSCQSSGNPVAGVGVRSRTFFGVEYPPENITVSKAVVSVVEGQHPETVLCSAKAYPEASYQWKREGQTDVIIKNKALILNYAIPRRDGGNYVCEAKNRHGSIFGVTYINVLFKPECAITQTEVNGRPVLICTAHANPKEVDFTWKIKNENETVDDPVETKGLQSYLTLENRVENFRTYLCFANNTVGMSVPCERDVTGKAAWWSGIDNDNLMIIVAIVIGAILMFLVICVVIILICRKKRADDKYNKPVELEERENPEGNSSTSSNPPNVPAPLPKWPLKPGVLVHVNSARLTQGLNSVKSSTPNSNSYASSKVSSAAAAAAVTSRSRSNRKLWNMQRRRAISMSELANPDDTSQRSRANRIRKMFSADRSDSLPSGIYHGGSGVTTFRRVDETQVQQPRASRKRKKPGDDPNPSGTVDKSSLGPRGSQPNGLDDRAFYENLPFHGMQNPPAKGELLFDSSKFNTVRPAKPSRDDPKFHSLRVYRKPRYRTSKVESSPKVSIETCEEKKECEEETPCVPDRKLKPKFFYVLKKKKDDETDEKEASCDDNESLLSGIERLSLSPAPKPAPRKLIANGGSKNLLVKHTYQNVPIPISPNNSQDFSSADKSEKSHEPFNNRLTSSQTQLLPPHDAYLRPRTIGRRKTPDKHEFTHSLRPTRKRHEGTINGSLKPNVEFFNSLRDADRQYSATEIRLKDTPLQVMRFKDLLKGVEKPAEPDREPIKNISSGEESLLRDVHRPIPVLPSMPHFGTPPPLYTPSADNLAGEWISRSNSVVYADLALGTRDRVISGERNETGRRTCPDYASLHFKDVGHEIDV